jgi:SAM-dependent methyltransferase
LTDPGDLPREHPFSDVDAQADPGAWVAVLDKLRHEPLYAPYKRRILELLDLRPGGTYLDVGCGTGADALTCETRFGVTVVGVDSSRVMVAEATRRGLTGAVAADAHALPFDADRFDGAWADRTFQHLADPPTALEEMVRIVKPGGRVVVADPDYGTQVVDVPDQDLAERVLRFRTDRGQRNGRLAHRMGRLCVRAGLADVRVEAMPVVVRDPTALDNALGLRGWARLAREEGLVDAREVVAWEEALDAAATSGCFLYAFMLFITTGRKPPGAR